MSLLFYNNKYATLDNVKAVVNFGLVTEYRRVYDAMKTKPSFTDMGRQNEWVRNLVLSGIWHKSDIIYNFAIHDSSEATLNWIDPGTNDASLVNNPTFTAYEGFAGTGTGFIVARWNPSIDASFFALNSATVGMYSRSESWDQHAMGWYSGSPTISNMEIAPNKGGNVFGAINGTGNNYVSDPDGYGMYIIADVSGGSTAPMYKNGSYIQHVQSDATYFPNKNLTVLKWNGGGNPASGQVSHVFLGGGMNGSQVQSWTNNYKTYMEFYGKNVV